MSVESPISIVDPLGLAPGDRCATADLAAANAIADINPRSIREDLEYGGWLVKLLGISPFKHNAEGASEMMKARPTLMTLALIFVAMNAASNERQVQETIEASMQVAGIATIRSDGKLLDYSITIPRKVDPDVRRLVDRYLHRAIFEVNTGEEEKKVVTVLMNLQLVARQMEGSVQMSVGDSVFWDPDTTAYIRPAKGKPLSSPDYPREALDEGFTGIVYLLLRLNQDGTVAEGHVEQVNLTGFATEAVMEKGRKLLSQAALAHAKQWGFEVVAERAATTGPIAVRVPVVFYFSNPLPPYEWHQYVRGPYVPPPWLDRNAAHGLGAMFPGQLYPVDHGKTEVTISPPGSIDTSRPPPSG